jgi:NTP pyrophosphatase (non-canonical NTP hydrolase)
MKGMIMENNWLQSQSIGMDREESELHWIARDIVRELRKHGFTAEAQPNRQILALAEEVGEFVGAYRRWTGQARRTGTETDAKFELADIVITAYVTAAELGWDLDAIVRLKAATIFTRGWGHAG